MIETTIFIEGMMCSMCEAHICDVLRGSFPVKKASASCKKGEAVVLSEQPLEESALRGAIAKTGYTVTAVRSKEAGEKKGLLGLFKK